MKRCKHNIDHHSMTPIGGEAFPGFDGGYVETLRCVKCGAWLSLGESNDEPEAVRVEIRAAEIAATVYRGPMGSLCFQRMPYAAWCSWIGAGPPDIGLLTPQMTLDYAAGHLARCIATHDGSGGE